MFVRFVIGNISIIVIHFVELIFTHFMPYHIGCKGNVGNTKEMSGLYSLIPASSRIPLKVQTTFQNIEASSVS